MHRELAESALPGTRLSAPVHDQQSSLEQWVQFGYQYPEGESLLKVVQRVYNFLDDIKQRYADKKVMVISHGGVCRVINSYFESLDNEDFFKFNLGNCKVLQYDL